MTKYPDSDAFFFQVEAAFGALGGVGVEAAKRLADWVCSGAFVEDEEGFQFPPIADKGDRWGERTCHCARAHAHVLMCTCE